MYKESNNAHVRIALKQEMQTVRHTVYIFHLPAHIFFGTPVTMHC